MSAAGKESRHSLGSSLKTGEPGFEPGYQSRHLSFALLPLALSVPEPLAILHGLAIALLFGALIYSGSRSH